MTNAKRGHWSEGEVWQEIMRRLRESEGIEKLHAQLSLDTDHPPEDRLAQYVGHLALSGKETHNERREKLHIISCSQCLSGLKQVASSARPVGPLINLRDCIRKWTDRLTRDISETVTPARTPQLAPALVLGTVPDEPATEPVSMAGGVTYEQLNPATFKEGALPELKAWLEACEGPLHVFEAMDWRLLLREQGKDKPGKDKPVEVAFHVWVRSIEDNMPSVTIILRDDQGVELAKSIVSGLQRDYEGWSAIGCLAGVRLADAETLDVTIE